MLNCLLTTFDRSFKSDSGMGGFLVYPMNVADPMVPYGWGFKIMRFVYDNMFNALLMVVMLQLLAGIIIDTFGQLREQLNEYNEDLENSCFICGFDKEKIEKESKNQRGFEHHIKKEHYQWNYIFYIAYISQKSQTEYTGIESYVAEKLSK